MNQPPQSASPTPPRIAPPWQPRFSILGLMLTTLVASVALAGISYLVRYWNHGHFGRLLFLLIILAGPLVLVVAVSVVRALSVRLARPRKRKSR